LVVLRERLTVRALALTITVFGAVLGFIGLVQSVTRTRLLLSEGGRVESLQNTISTYDDVTRSIVPGTTLVSFVFFLALARLLSGDAKVKRIWWWLVLTLTAGGILVNFGRTLWVATIALAIVILFRAGNGVRAFRVLAVCSMLAVVASVFVYVTKPIVFESIVDRVVSSREEGRPSSSWSWRKFENQFAVSSIQSRPLLGVGMGGDYKPFQPGLGKFDDLQSSYIHNSYLFLPLKLGVPAALLVLAVLGWLTVRLNRSVPDMVEDSFSRSILLACGASALQFMGMAYIQPQFNAFGGVLVFAIVAGLSESIRSSEVREPASTASKSKRRKSIDAAILRHVSPKV
jgi:O-antigen ligase